MSNDTYYRLEFRHPKKARLKELKTYLTEIKPAICQFVQQMNFDPDWTKKRQLKLLGIQKWNELTTWFTPYTKAWFARTTDRGGNHVLMMEEMANESSSNVWISGPDGDLADLIRRFPDVNIIGKYVDDYGAGEVRGFEKIFKMNLEEHENARILENLHNPDVWGDRCLLSLATKELILAADHGILDLKRLSRLIRQGADVNIMGFDKFPLFWLQFDCPEDLGKAVALILSAGWQHDKDTKATRKSLIDLARNLGDSSKNRPIRRKMAAAMLGRKPGKHEDGAQLFQDSLSTRDLRGLIASAFLVTNFETEVAKVSKSNRTWLRRQGLWEDYDTED